MFSKSIIMWSTAAHGIGCIVLTKFLYDIGYFVYVCFFRPCKDLKKYGEWAVVTGATDGIGKAIAKELLRKGLKVLLISRDEGRLKDTVKEIGGGETLCVDFNEFGPEKRAEVKKALDSRDVGVLVNNVGISYEHPEYLHELDEDRIEKLVKLNIDSTNFMTYMVLPKMVEKKRGAIVNMSSGSCLISCPLLAAYSAAKRYIEQLSVSLAAEYASKGISVQVQCPLYVTSKLSKFRKATITTPSPDGYAKAAVKAIGYENSTSPYWAHYLIMGVAKALPSAFVASAVNSMHLGIRKKAYAKKNK